MKNTITALWLMFVSTGVAAEPVDVHSDLATIITAEVKGDGSLRDVKIVTSGIITIASSGKLISDNKGGVSLEMEDFFSVGEGKNGPNAARGKTLTLPLQSEFRLASSLTRVVVYVTAGNSSSGEIQFQKVTSYQPANPAKIDRVDTCSVAKLAELVSAGD